MEIMDYDRLRGRIVSEHHSVKAFAKKHNYKINAVYRILNNQTDLTTSAINRLCSELDIARAEIPMYFFTEKTNKSY